MKKGKRIFSLGLAVMMTMSTMFSAFALDREFENEGGDFEWSPNCTTDIFLSQSQYNIYITPESEFSWTSTAATKINEEKYTTMEHNTGDGTSLHVTDQYCNEGNVHFDVDDDDLDNRNEESEVVFLGKVTANHQYTFRTQYMKSLDSETTGNITTVVQRSSKMLSEYQALDYDLLSVDAWNWNYSRAAQETDSRSGVLLSDVSDNKIISHNVGATESELNSYFENQKNVFIGNSSVQSISDEAEELTKVTVTFAYPISMAQLLSLVEDCGGSLDYYQAKFTNSEGEWCTAGSVSTDETAFVTWANEAAQSVGKPHISYDGIVSMRVVIPATEYAYSQLNNSDLVFSVDLSEYLWRHSSEYDPNVKLIVPSYEWDVAHFS